MIAQSQSGTGKTAAFVLAMLSRVDPSKPYPQVTGSFHSIAKSIGVAPYFLKVLLHHFSKIKSQKEVTKQ
jgi:hypothetical protein